VGGGARAPQLSRSVRRTRRVGGHPVCKTSRDLPATLVALIITLSSTLFSSSHASTQPDPERLTLQEAEILIYLLPAAHANRKIGRDVAWERETSAMWNQADFFYFYVMGTNPPPGTASVTVGHFAVNKHTGDLWSTVPEERVESVELRGVQEILRHAHRIGADTIARYRGTKLSAE
jgi:hypothetical protein